MANFSGPIWETLYQHYGRATVTVRLVTSYSALGQMLQDLQIPEVQEMNRIDVELNDGFQALIKIFCEKSDVLILHKIVSRYLRHPTWRFRNARKIRLDEIIELIFDSGFREAFLNVTFRSLFRDWPTMLKSAAAQGDGPELWTRCNESIFCHSSTTNCLGLMIADPNGTLQAPRLRMDIIRYFLGIGVMARQLRPRVLSPLTIALLNFQPYEIIKAMAENDVDFRLTSALSRLQIPDALMISMYYSHHLTLYIMMMGGFCLNIPVEVAEPDEDLPYVKTAEYSRFVCCELNIFYGLMPLMAEFCLILPLCDSCKLSTGLESSIPSLQSICRMTYRAQFRSSRLLRNDINIPRHYPELYREYMMFNSNPFDSVEFVSAMADRDPRSASSFANYLRKPEWESDSDSQDDF